jgi:hypothetical protein
MHCDTCFQILENPQHKVCLRTSWRRCWRLHARNVRESLLRVRMYGLQGALKSDSYNANFNNNDLYWCIKHYETDLVRIACV